MRKNKFTEISKSLKHEGWFSPNTYCNVFREPDDISAVYLFLCVSDYEDAFVGYVGMSTRLSQRLSGHPILSNIRRNSDFWVMTWFTPVQKPKLRTTELSYIQRFDPPWNVVGKKRGMEAL